MAEIFAARVNGAGGFEKDVVVKRILPAFAGDPTFRERFFQEARLAAQLTHPNIVQTYELVEQDGDTLLAMEAVHGADIATLLRVTREAGKPLPVSCALHIAASIADALAYAHDKKGPDGVPLGLVHRDVTPSNVLVSVEGVPKLIDFGIAKAASGSAPQTQAGLVLGKAWYLSPEQCLGQLVDGKSDVFALGVVLFQMLAGRVPFGGRSGITAMDKIAKGQRPALASLVAVPKVVEQVVDAALIVDRELRPSAKVWRAQIERALSAVDPERRARDELAELVQRAHDAPHAPHASHASHAPHAPHAPPGSPRVSPAPVAGMAANAPTLLLMDLSAASAEASKHGDDGDDDDGLTGDTGDTGEVKHGAAGAGAGESAGAMMSDVRPVATTIDAAPPDGVRAARAAQTSSRGLVAAGFVAMAGAIGAVALVVWLRGDDAAPRDDKVAPPPTGAIASELRQRGAPDGAPDGATDGAIDAVDEDVDEEDGEVVEEGEDESAIEASDGGAAQPRATKPRKKKKKRSSRTKTAAVASAERPGDKTDAKASAKVEGKGVITFHADPWAQVWLGSKSLGMTWTGSIDVPAGKHTLFLKNPVSGHEKTIVVDVKPGSRQSMYVTLEKRASPK
jgi:tRNA A-37 threonylcarbamoyl transferase component Bud32